MTKTMQIFNNPEFGEIRATTLNGEPWFVAKDIAKQLCYANPQKAVRDHVQEEDRTVNEKFTVNGTSPTLINESGMYSLILSCKLAKAKNFNHWITSEVLPSIRKTGNYGQATIDVQMITQIATAVCSEVIKQLLPLIRDNEFQEETIEVSGKKRRNSPQWSIIGRLDTELREEAESLISSGRFTAAEIKKHFTEQHGVNISTSSIARYRNAMREQGLMEFRLF